ncbi:MAG TPA: metallophosphoesterase [Chitinophagaceae bacterium]|nr:metallophosphoesterase [Chitinophagaceae bacterium]
MKKLLLTFFYLFTLTIMIPSTSGYGNHHLSGELQIYDGPYVHYKGDRVFINYIMKSDGTKNLKTDSIALQQKDNLLLKVMTDIPGKSFSVGLKKKLSIEKSETPKVKKLLVLSDIEGNFAALRKLLQANNVIDEDFNWKFGNGHLVLVGDFFDRGTQVTEVLWFIYYLEEKAKAAGGYVHFILGNHEIMNLSGDLRFVQQKYLDNASLLNEKYVTLYDENSELGRWLRTKNIVEKIGDIVFAHGGISGDINSMNISVNEMNSLARPYYADTISHYTDEKSAIIFSDLGPFWYRGYYEKSNHGIPVQIDSTLAQLDVNHIITGHTIVSDIISVWYNGKLLDTDVHHAGGKSEALLIENGKYYRVNAEGKKVLLIDENQ